MAIVMPLEKVTAVDSELIEKFRKGENITGEEFADLLKAFRTWEYFNQVHDFIENELVEINKNETYRYLTEKCPDSISLFQAVLALTWRIEDQIYICPVCGERHAFLIAASEGWKLMEGSGWIEDEVLDSDGDTTFGTMACRVCDHRAPELSFRLHESINSPYLTKERLKEVTRTRWGMKDGPKPKEELT